MLRAAFILAAALYAASPEAYYVYEKAYRDTALCEQDKTLTGIYTPDSYAELERKTAPQDIYITYLTEGDDFPSAFITLCMVKDRLPLIILRPAGYSPEYINEFASRLAQYNSPILVQIDSSLSEKHKQFFRSAADIIHAKAPSAAMVWGISDNNIQKLSLLYPGDSYVDWAALNIFERADRDGIITDPYPVFDILSFFERSKPVMINLSVASYTDDGHKYFTYEASREIERIYSLPERSSAVKAINYISKASSAGNAYITNSPELLGAFKRACTGIKQTENVRLPVMAYRHGDSFYCEEGIIPTESEHCIINGKRRRKIKNAGRYVFTSVGVGK